MIKIGICDDNAKIVSKIKRYIESYDKEKADILTFKNGEELLGKDEVFDAIFLDIDMDGINGIETAQKIRRYDKDVKIIYVTSYTEYTNAAFSVHAFGYLNKPVKQEEIFKQLDEVISYGRKSKKEEPCISFIAIDGVVRMHPKDIYYFEYFNRKIKMNTNKGVFILKEKIMDIARKMEQYGFYMPHKSFTVNLYHVKSINGYDSFMMNGNIVPLSQKKSVIFREKLNEFIAEQI